MIKSHTAFVPSAGGPGQHVFPRRVSYGEYRLRRQVARLRRARFRLLCITAFLVIAFIVSGIAVGRFVSGLHGNFAAATPMPTLVLRDSPAVSRVPPPALPAWEPAHVYAETEAEPDGNAEADEAEAVTWTLKTFVATAYCPCIVCTGHYSHEHGGNPPGFVQRTASGTVPREGRTIAVDTSVIPFGTEVYIVGLGWRTAEDRGGAIRGATIDIFMESHQAALNWGRREVAVFMPKGRE